MGATRPDEVRGRGRWRRRLRWGLAGAAALLLATAATVDWWLPAAATGWAGATYSARETEFGKTITWRGLKWSDAGTGIALDAGLARIDAPSRILRQGIRTDALIEDWTLTITPVEAAPDRGKTAFGWPELMDALRETGDLLADRLGGARLKDGRLWVAGEEVGVRQMELTPRKVGGELVWRDETVLFEIDLAGNKAWVAWDRGGVRMEVKLDGRDKAAGTLAWAKNTAPFSAEFSPGSWVPRAFSLTGDDWQVPAERLGLAGKYADLRGDFVARRDGAGVSVALDAKARPLAEGLPEVKIEAAGVAQAEFARLERLAIEAPWLKAKLSAPLEWRRGGGIRGVGEPVFSWEAELGALSAGKVKGEIAGSARWMAAEGWRVAWEAQGTGLEWGELHGVDATLRGESTADQTRLIEAELRGTDGLKLVGQGVWRHVERRIEEGRFAAEAPGAALRRWLPEGLLLGRVTGQGSVTGGLSAPKVDATVSVETVAYQGWVADRAEAAVAGSLAEGLSARARLESGRARIDADVLWTPEQAVAKTFTVHRGDGRELALVRPLILRLAGERRSVTADWAGPEAALRINWEERGASSVFIENVDTSWLAEWRGAQALPELAVRLLQVDGRVGEVGWIEGAGKVDAVWTRAGEPAVWARAEGTAGPEGLKLARLEAGQGGELLASGGGVVPWRVRVGAVREVLPVEGAAWSLRLDSSPEATVWEALAKWAGVELEGPGISLALTGPATEPSGRVELSAARIGLSGEGLPDGGLELRALKVAAGVSLGEVTVERLEAEVDGQRVEADGKLAMAAGDWEKLRARPYIWLRDHAEARLRLPEAKVAALARYLPTMLAPAGTVAAELRLTPGANLDGVLRLHGASTRPIGSFGVLQEIEAELTLAGRDVRVTKLRALAGGQEVAITGGARRVPGRMPLLDLKVKAERFPLVRQPGLLLRGDLDLAAKTEAAADGSAGRTRVTGTVRLRDSLFLADIRPLIAADAGSAAAVRARPPYFSVETKPLSEWELDVRVAGDRFLRMRTPVFEGTGSAHFDLEGTLREPRATGEFRVERGTILVPFATFTVQEGAVRLTRADPFTPTLDFRATGRRLGYDLRLELNGTANSPQLQFFSSPPLEAETVVLMVTAGAAPTEGQGAASTSQRLAAVGAYVGRDLLRTLGLGGADEERLTLSAGEKVSRQGRETYGFEFQLTDKWSLTGEYDEFDAYNVGFKRRLREAEPAVEKKEEPDAR